MNNILKDENQKEVKYAKKYYYKLKKRYINSISFYIFLNLVLFSLAAGSVILNLYAIRFNNDVETKILFLVISGLTSASTLITAIYSIIYYRTNLSDVKRILKRINKNIKMYKSNESPYNDDDALEKFFNNISDILIKE